jgi:hypothetical protein
MIVEEIFCTLMGNDFSPRILMEKTGLFLADCKEKGQNHDWGKRLPSEYGFANLVVPKNLAEGQSEMDWMAQTLAQYHSLMIELGVEDFEVTVLIDAYTGILNWWINHENMKIFGDLGINISFTASFQGIEEGVSENSEIAEQ